MGGVDSVGGAVGRGLASCNGRGPTRRRTRRNSPPPHRHTYFQIYVSLRSVKQAIDRVGVDEATNG